jgi:iron complex transport system substrate-binding protein
VSDETGGARRIVSLIASATEIVCALGLRDRLVGISHECDYPPDIRGLPVLSSPKLDVHASSAAIDAAVRDLVREGLSVYQVDDQKLAELQPDLIVTQDQCAVCAVSLADVEAAVCRRSGIEARICSLQPHLLADVRADFGRVAQAAGVPAAGEQLLASFDDKLAAVKARASGQPSRTIACIEWIDPVMVAGGWMPELVRLAGGRPVICEEPGRFVTTDWQAIVDADPDVIAIMPCGYGVEKTMAELQASDVARAALGQMRGRCFVLDGNAYFNRPGPRLADSADILAHLMHDGICPQEAGRPYKA